MLYRRIGCPYYVPVCRAHPVRQRRQLGRLVIGQAVIIHVDPFPYGVLEPPVFVP
jgi:hypothetical protein